LPSAKNNTLGKELFAKCKKKHSANSHLCRVPKNNTLSKELFAVCIYFAECFLYDTWQRPYLPSARKNTLGKDSALGKYQVFRSVRGECAWVVSV